MVDFSMIYTTNLGRMYTGNCQEILANDLEILKGKVNLIFTSPPFPLNRAKKYGNMTGDEYLEWFANLGPFFKDYLTPDGSIVMELGNAYIENSKKNITRDQVKTSRLKFKGF